MQLLHCDKTIQTPSTRCARRGTPRRKRRGDSRTTAYELTIRIPRGSTVVISAGRRNSPAWCSPSTKKIDLKGQVRAFEEEKNAVLDLALRARGGGLARRRRLGSDALREYAERYVERRVGVISPASTANERRYLKYAKATIRSILEGARRRGRRAVRARGAPPVRGVGAREEGDAEENRRLRQEGGSRGGPLLARTRRRAGDAVQGAQVRARGPQRCVDREHVGRNVAKKRFLSKGFRKGRPLIDPLMEDEAEAFLEEASSSPST